MAGVAAIARQQGRGLLNRHELLYTPAVVVALVVTGLLVHLQNLVVQALPVCMLCTGA